MRKIWVTFSVLLALGWGMSCTSTNLDELRPAPPDKCEQVYTFADTVQKLVEINCSDPGQIDGSGCHAAGAGQGDFTSYAGVKDKVDNGQFSARVSDQQNMPPTYSPGPTALTPCELEIISNWIAAGAPQ